MMFCGFPSSKTVNAPLIEIGDDVLLVVDDGGVQHDLVHVFVEDEDALVVDLVLLIILLVRGALDLSGGGWGRGFRLVRRTPFAMRRPATRGGRTRKQRTPGALFRRCVVSRPGIHPERRQSFRWQQLHFYLTPFAVAHCFVWTVSEHILVA